MTEVHFQSQTINCNTMPVKLVTLVTTLFQLFDNMEI